MSEHIIEEQYLMDKPLYSQLLSIQSLLDSNKETIKDFEATYLLMPYEPDMNILFYGKVDSSNPLIAIIHVLSPSIKTHVK